MQGQFNCSEDLRSGEAVMTWENDDYTIEFRDNGSYMSLRETDKLLGISETRVIRRHFREPQLPLPPIPWLREVLVAIFTFVAMVAALAFMKWISQ